MRVLKMSDVIAVIDVNQYIHLSLCDQTSHYFGGYYHVKVQAYCDVPLVEEFFENVEKFRDARSRMGELVRFERIIEKMAVPRNEIEAVRNQLVNAFNETTLVYLSAPDFAGRFVRSAYLKCINKPAKRHNYGG